MGILLVDLVVLGIVSDARLNTLSGGHPLGGRLPLQGKTFVQRLNTLSGGHPLGGGPDSGSHCMEGCLNTLSGGHPLGGARINQYNNTRGVVSIPSQVGILLVVNAGSRHFVQ